MLEADFAMQKMQNCLGGGYFDTINYPFIDISNLTRYDKESHIIENDYLSNLFPSTYMP